MLSFIRLTLFHAKRILKNMCRLQEAYNELKESSLTRDDALKLQEDLVETKKQLAVEKRGMSYDRVSELLEGASTDEEIENRLNSLSSLSKQRQTNITLSDTLTESRATSADKRRLSGLASIIAKV